MADSSCIRAPTVNPNQILQFKQMGSIWWTGNKEIHPLRVFNEIRVPWIIDRLKESGIIDKDADNNSKPLQNLSILDVGCGGGYLAEALAELGCTIVGIDPCSELIQVARDHLALNPSLTNLTYICGSLEDHIKDNYEKYDVVIASEVIDHVDEPDLFLDLCIKCLKPGGSYFLTTFNKTWKAWFKVIILFEYVIKMIPHGTHSWHKFYTPEDIQKRLEKYNCQTNVVQGMFYSYFTGKWSCTSDTSITYGLHAVKNTN